VYGGKKEKLRWGSTKEREKNSKLSILKEILPDSRGGGGTLEGKKEKGDSSLGGYSKPQQTEKKKSHNTRKGKKGYDQGSSGHLNREGRRRKGGTVTIILKGKGGKEGKYSQFSLEKGSSAARLPSGRGRNSFLRRGGGGGPLESPQRGVKLILPRLKGGKEHQGSCRDGKGEEKKLPPNTYGGKTPCVHGRAGCGGLDVTLLRKEV